MADGREVELAADRRYDDDLWMADDAGEMIVDWL
jgi:hypothetical protein